VRNAPDNPTELRDLAGLSVAEEVGLDRRKLLGAAAGTALGMAGLAGFGAHGARAALMRGSDDKGIIVFGQGFTNADVYKPLIKGALAEGKKRGYKILQSYDNGDASKQITEINTWIAQGVNALSILPLNEKAMTPLIKKAHDKGIKWVTYAGTLPGEDGYVWWDNFGGGEAFAKHCAKWIKRELGGKAEVVLFTADFFVNGRQRVHGAYNALKKLAPGAKVVAQTQAILAADTYKAMQSVLSAHPNVNVVICIADDGAIGAEKAFLATRPSKDRIRQMYITGYDGSRVAMKRVLTGGSLRSSIALPLKAIGASAVWVPANLLEGKKPTRIKHKYILVTAENPAVGRKLIADFL
jgi:ABC-type sugar transport system substrate-binding protein